MNVSNAFAQENLSSISSLTFLIQPWLYNWKCYITHRSTLLVIQGPSIKFFDFCQDNIQNNYLGTNKCAGEIFLEMPCDAQHKMQLIYKNIFWISANMSSVVDWTATVLCSGREYSGRVESYRCYHPHTWESISGLPRKKLFETTI